MRRFAIPAAFAALSLSFALAAAAPALAEQQPTPAQQDLGIDITQAGGTHGSVQRFLTDQSPDARAAVLTACQNILQDPTSHDVTTEAFCRLAL